MRLCVCVTENSKSSSTSSCGEQIVGTLQWVIQPEVKYDYLHPFFVCAKAAFLDKTFFFSFKGSLKQLLEAPEYSNIERGLLTL